MNLKYWKLTDTETGRTVICSGYSYREAFANALTKPSLIGGWSRICDGYAYDVFGVLWVIDMI